MLARATGVAVSALGVLAASGFVMAMQQLGGLAELRFTAYGMTLDAKVVVVAAAILLGVLATRATGQQSWRWRFGEALTVLIVLALAGLLVSLPPRQ